MIPYQKWSTCFYARSKINISINQTNNTLIQLYVSIYELLIRRTITISIKWLNANNKAIIIDDESKLSDYMIIENDWPILQNIFIDSGNGKK